MVLKELRLHSSKTTQIISVYSYGGDFASY
jgi:hypothetical protein